MAADGVEATGRERGRRLGWLLAIVLAFAGTRLVSLAVLPVFVDESIHVVWASRVASEARLSRPWQHGRALQVVASAAVVTWAPDPVQAARALSVLVAALGLWAAYDLGRRLYGRDAARAAALVYVLCPFALFYDRLALADPYLAAFAALALARSVALVRAPTWPRALLVAALLVATVLSKVPGLVLLHAPLAALLLLCPAPRAGRYVAAAYAAAGVALAYPVYYFLRASPLLVPDRAGVRDSAGVLANVMTAGGWIAAYVTVPLLLAAGLGLLASAPARWREGLLLAVSVAAPVVGLSLVAHHWAPRFMLPVTIPLCVLAGHGAAWVCARLRTHVTRRLAFVTLAVLAAWPALRFDASLLTAPLHAPLPAEDRFAFVDGWPSGYGTEDALRFVRARLDEQPGRPLTVAFHERAERTVLLALRAAFLSRQQVEILTLNLDEPGRLEELRRRGRPVYAVLTPPLEASPALTAAARRAVTGRKPDGELVVEVFALSPSHGTSP